MTEQEMKTCAKCAWFHRQKNNVGKCGNWEKMAVDGIQNLPHRFATDTCDGWRKRESR